MQVVAKGIRGGGWEQSPVDVSFEPPCAVLASTTLEPGIIGVCRSPRPHRPLLLPQVTQSCQTHFRPMHAAVATLGTPAFTACPAAAADKTLLAALAGALPRRVQQLHVCIPGRRGRCRVLYRVSTASDGLAPGLSTLWQALATVRDDQRPHRRDSWAHSEPASLASFAAIHAMYLQLMHMRVAEAYGPSWQELVTEEVGFVKARALSKRLVPLDQQRTPAVVKSSVWSRVSSKFQQWRAEVESYRDA